LHAGVHTTAAGAGTPTRQELDAAILQRADLLVADSISQCLARGEIHQALKQGCLVQSELVELGDVIAGNTPGRTSDGQITVADLTGVAVQDIKIATAVYEHTIRRGAA
jgi:ornithine cyclodeaminase